MIDDSLTQALTLAADGDLAAVRELLARGADPTGMPLIMAIQCDEAEIVQLMIAAGAEVNTPFQATTPLVRAITAGYPKIVDVLLQAGAQVNQVAPDGTIPLEAARTRGRTNLTDEERDQIVQLLINAGAHA